MFDKLHSCCNFLERKELTNELNSLNKPSHETNDVKSIEEATAVETAWIEQGMFKNLNGIEQGMFENLNGIEQGMFKNLNGIEQVSSLIHHLKFRFTINHELA